MSLERSSQGINVATSCDVYVSRKGGFAEERKLKNRHICGQVVVRLTNLITPWLHARSVQMSNVFTFRTQKLANLLAISPSTDAAHCRI